MTVLALLVLGVVAFFNMPVSLLPDIDIPVVKVRVEYNGVDARTLENTIVKPLRRQLMQVTGIKNIESNTGDGFSEIVLHFTYKTKSEYAYIEVNEKVDDMTPLFPRDMARPQVIKKKPSDIPVFYISIVPTSTFFKNGNNFIDFSNYVQDVAKRRFEQIDEVSMVDISGIIKPQIVIEPFQDKLNALGLTNNDITTAIQKENIRFGSLSFHDGYFVYRLRFKSVLRTVDDFKKINVFKNGKLFPLSDLAKIKMEYDDGNGMFFHNGKRAVSFAVYKQVGARTADVSKKISAVINQLEQQTEGIVFERERDQTKLLKYSLNNLQQTLLLGIILSMGIMFLFYRKPQLPFILALTIPISLTISFFFLYLTKISINIISLSGLILSVGLMIDNSIVVIDNINQYRMRGIDAFDAVVAGTNEVIRPLISSVLTTSAVFVPLIALSGIAGALFYSQAVTIVISLSVSLFVSIMVLPVLYRLFNKNSSSIAISSFSNRLLQVYENALTFVMNHKTLFGIGFFLFIPIGIFLYFSVDKQQFPDIEQTDIIVNIEWNEPIVLKENNKRVQRFVDSLKNNIEISSVYTGKSGFSLTDDANQSFSSAYVYLNFGKVFNNDKVEQSVKNYFYEKFPAALIVFSASQNIFNAVFNPDEPALIAKFRPNNNLPVTINYINGINNILEANFPLSDKNKDAQVVYVIQPQYSKILLYNIEYQDLITKLKTIFGGENIDKISSGNKTLPIIIRNLKNSMYEVFSTETIKNKDGIDIPLRSVIDYKLVNLLKTINSDERDEYYGVDFSRVINNDTYKTVIKKISSVIKNSEISWSGTLKDRPMLFKEFIFVLVISIILLYLILAAQFESLLLPVIILTEIVFDIAGSLLFLKIFGVTLNVMSLLGIIVMSGIVINDSIIKVDTMQKEMKKGLPILQAIYTGGKRRFFPIIMTSLTTILALIPLLFYSGLGVELQLPLAVSVIGGLTLGTFVSLFFIPVMFYYFVRITEK